jgi:hypothetical protein
MKNPMFTFVVAATTVLSCIFMARPLAAEEPKGDPLVVVVIAEGQGETIDEAKAAALRAAIEDVVGSLMKTATTTENGEVVQDKILSASSAYVEKSTQVGPAKQDEDGLYTIKVKANVRKAQLVGELEKFVAEIKGAEMLEKIEQLKKNQAQFESFFQSEFENALSSVVVAQPLAEPGCLPFQLDDDDNVFMDVNVGIDPDAYRVFRKGVVEKLRPFAQKVESVDGESGSGTRTWRTDAKNTLLVVRDYKTLVADLMTFSPMQIKTLCKVFAKVNKSDNDLTVVVRMFDKDGETIFTKKAGVRSKADSFPWRRVLLHSNKEEGVCAILPALNFGASRHYSYTKPNPGPVKVRMKLGAINPDVLGNVDLVSVELVPPGKK